MRNMFKTMETKVINRQETGMANNKPRLTAAIEHLDAANTHMEQAMQVLSSIIMDWQRAADFLVKYRNSLVKTIEETGGDVTPSIESQIRDFIPPKHRESEVEGQQ